MSSSDSSTNKLHTLCCSSSLPSSSNRKTAHSLANFLITYFDFSYFLCCSPFRLVSDKDGVFHVKSALPQKIFCAILNSLGFLVLMTELRKLIPLLTDDRSPLNYFGFLSSMFSFAYQMLTLKRFWLHQEDFLNIVNFVKHDSITLHKGARKMQSKTFIRIICTIFAIMALYEVIWRRLFAPSPEYQVWNRKLVSDARYMFFLTNNATQSDPEDWSAVDISLAIIVALGWIEKHILGFYLDLGIFFTVLTAWTATYLFAQSLEMGKKGIIPTEENKAIVPSIAIPNKAIIDTKQSNWPEIYKNFHYIRDLCQLINSTFGGILTMYLAASILFHSTGMDTVVVTPDIAAKLRLLFFICTSIAIFVLSADTCHHMDSLKLWLGKDENRRHVPADQLNFVMNELQFHMVGVRGSNIFTITYPLLWNVMTTVVTYFIICLQTRQQLQDQQHR